MSDKRARAGKPPGEGKVPGGLLERIASYPGACSWSNRFRWAEKASSPCVADCLRWISKGVIATPRLPRCSSDVGREAVDGFGHAPLVEQRHGVVVGPLVLLLASGGLGLVDALLPFGQSFLAASDECLQATHGCDHCSICNLEHFLLLSLVDQTVSGVRPAMTDWKVSLSVSAAAWSRALTWW